MVKKIKELFKELLLSHWPRKGLALILATIVWFVVHKSLTMTKTIENVPIQIENVPPGKVVEGMEPNGLLNKKVHITLSGNKKFMNQLLHNDLYVSLNAENQEEGEWIASITQATLRSHRHDLSMSNRISKIVEQNVLIKITRLISESVTIVVTKPIGRSPGGYEFLDVWPYELNMIVSGPENIVQNLKNKGLNLTFNLSQIDRKDLDKLRMNEKNNRADVVSFFIPNEWKKIYIPALSLKPIEINDPNGRFLKIDFLRSEQLKLDASIPVSLYFPGHTLRPTTFSKYTILPNHIIENYNGLKLLRGPFYVKGVSPLFLDIVKDMLQMSIIVDEQKKNGLDWSVQYINAKVLEERYLHSIAADSSGNRFSDYPTEQEYLRNRFRQYMNRFQLYTENGELVKLLPQLEGTSVVVFEEKNDERVAT